MTIANTSENNGNNQVAQFLAPETSTEQFSNTSICASPYNRDAAPFYFSTFEEYETKAENHTDCHGSPVEEYELIYCEGSDAELFEACGINQANLATWFDDIEDMDDDQKAALYFLTSVQGYNLDQAMDKVEDVMISKTDLVSAADELFEECYAHNIPESIRYYFDIEKFARDIEINGDMTEFEFQGQTFTCTNASGI